MKWGFDLDGTLDHPEIAALANVLFDAGHEVHILTGCIPNSPTAAEHKPAKLARLGVRYTKIHLCEGETMEDMGYTKAQVLRRENIPLMIDDDPTFVKQMVHYSTSRILLVL